MPTYPPIAASRDTEETRQAVERALSKRGWEVQAEVDGEIVAVFEKRDRRLWVRISYDAHEVRTEYVDSENLECTPPAGVPASEGKCATIHGAYAVWVDEWLRSDIQEALEASEEPPVETEEVAFKGEVSLGESSGSAAVSDPEKALVLESDPPGARVERNGVFIGTTPLVREYPKSYFSRGWSVFHKFLGEPVTVTLYKEGYEPKHVTLSHGPLECDRHRSSRILPFGPPLHGPPRRR